MAIRRSRRHRNKLDATTLDTREQEEERAAERAGRSVRTAGPWDVSDEAAQDVERLDLGALKIPVLDGYELRVEISPEGAVLAASMVNAQASMQVGAFAAPRTGGIWDEVRREIQGSVAAQGGTAETREGVFGMELRAKLPVQGGYQALRFVGVDGPRWFLRAVLAGSAAIGAAADLDDALRQVIVDRGDEPKPVREPLPLTLPEEVAEQLAAAQAEAVAQAEAEGLSPGDRSASGSAGMQV